MDKYTAAGDKKTLTLAFEKSATRETKIFHPRRYFIAGGETLRQIEQIISDFSSAEQGYADLAKKAGAKSYDGNTYSFQFDFKKEETVPLTGTERVDYHANGNLSEPWQSARIPGIPNFIVTTGRAPMANSTPMFRPKQVKKSGMHARP